MTTFTQTLAWCTWYTEFAHSAHSVTPGDVIYHPQSYAWAHLFDSPLLFYFHLFFPVFFSFHFLHSELYPELHNLIVMESLCYSANKGSDDAYDVSTSLTESKKMIQEVGNIEMFELLETNPKTQCTACLSYWNVGIVYCTCGHFLQKETEANRHFVKYTMDLHSLPEYVIKKERLHGHRYGKKLGDKEYYLVNPIEEEMQKEKVPRNPWPILTRSWIPCPNDWT